MSTEEETIDLKIDTPKNNLSESTISEKEFRRKTYWKSCCGCTLDKRALTFFSQLFISLIMIVFCLYKLHTLDKCDSDVYMSLLTMILGIYVEAPRLN